MIANGRVRAAEARAQARTGTSRGRAVRGGSGPLSASWALCALCLPACAVTVAAVLATGPPEPMLTPAPARPH